MAADGRPEATHESEFLARFSTSRDEVAYFALLKRHGPTVWDVRRTCSLSPPIPRKPPGHIPDFGAFRGDATRRVSPPSTDGYMFAI